MKAISEGIGFRTANPADRVALRGVHLQARLAGMSLRATLDQTFVNLESRAIEAVYTFPLPEGAAVCGFEVITADRVLTGTIEEINAGIEQYEQALSEGHGAFLMEQERPDVFTVRVGNLKPRQAATIRLSYVCALERVDKSIRVSFPTTIAPRYATATGADPIEAAIDGDALNPPHVLRVPYGLSIEVDVALGRKLARVSSPGHAMNIANGKDAACRITFAGGIAEMDRDVILLLDLAEEHQPCVQASRGGEGESYLAVTFVPEFDVDALRQPAACETVFVLDCSGSMQGESMMQAIAALELCLRSMSIGDTFNICRFGTTWELMASEPLIYSQATLDRALAYVGQMRDLGGTEIYPPLEAILGVKPRTGTVRQIILLTDGQVSNEPAVVELARKHRKYNRIFSFGIGAASSAFLVKGIARATGGAAEFITAGERIDDKVLRTFGRIASPPVTDISIDWDGCDVQTLAELPPIFDGDVLAVFGRAPTRLPRTITLSCDTPAGPQRWSVEVPPPVQDDGVIATMWARRTIQSMEEVNGLAATRSRVAAPGRERDMLIQLSKQFRLLCSLTTYVAVEHRSVMERTNGDPAVRRVPTKLAAGWGGVDLAAGCAAPACAAPMVPRLKALPAQMGGPRIYRTEVPSPASPAAGAANTKRNRKARFFGRYMPATGGGKPPTDRTVDRSFDRTDRPIDRDPSPVLGSLDKTMDRSRDITADHVYLEDGLADDPTVAPIANLIYAILRDAYQEKASQIQFVAFPDRLEVHYIINGVVSVRDQIPRKMQAAMLMRLKCMAGMNPADPHVPQTGVVVVTINGERVEYRAGTLPSSHNEVIALEVVKVGPPTALDEELKAILALQSAEGWFGWNRTVKPHDALDKAIVAMGGDGTAWSKAAHAALPAVTGATWEPDRAARTAIALVVLTSRAKSLEAIWKRAYLKAVRYLAPVLGMEVPQIEKWLEQLRQNLGV